MATVDLEWLGGIILVIQLAFLFIFLGTAASDYFCPNLSTLSEAMNLPEDVAGVTLLALGNSAPDLTSSIIAIHSADAVGMAVGELIGAGLFIGGVVMGSIVLSARRDADNVQQIELDRGSFLRDTGFLLLSVLLLGVILINGKMMWWEGLMMIILYLIYVGIVIAMGAIQRNREKQQERGLLDYAEPVDPYITTALSPDIPAIVITNPDCASDASSQRSDFISHSRLRRPRRVSVSSGSSVCSTWSQRVIHDRVHSLQEKCLPKSVVAAVDLLDAANNEQMEKCVTCGPSPSPDASFSKVINTHVTCPTCREALEMNEANTLATSLLVDVQYGMRTIANHLFPIFSTFHVHGIIGKIVHIFSIPAVFLLGLTVPVVSQDFDSENDVLLPTDDSIGEQCDTCKQQTPAEMEAPDLDIHDQQSLLHEAQPLLPASQRIAAVLRACDAVEWHHRWILIIQSFLCPLFILYALDLWYYNLIPIPERYFPCWIFGIVLGVAVAFATFLFTHPYSHSNIKLRQAYINHGISRKQLRLPWRHPLVACIGFIVGIFWIYLIATEVVGLLKALGSILDISDAILGITLFAFGNSIGDFISNITMAKLGYPRMAIAASLGGPLLNLLITLGVSGVLSVSKPSPSEFLLSTNVLLCISGLIIMLIVDLIYVPLKKYKVSRAYGIWKLSLYVFVIVATIALDTLGLEIPGLPSNDA